MLPPSSPLDLLMRQLTPEQRRTVMAFARFLARENEGEEAEREGETPEEGEESTALPAEPLGIPRPAEEKPVQALKRLKRNYPMLTAEQLLSEAAGLMMKHHVMGHDGDEVIDQLEGIFANEYERWRRERQGTE